MYKKYIDLGFVRTDLDDNVEFRNTGYYGFTLDKIINEKLSIVANSGELESPLLYIKKANGINYHIIKTTFEVVNDLLIKKTKGTYNTLLCC